MAKKKRRGKVWVKGHHKTNYKRHDRGETQDLDIWVSGHYRKK